MNKKTISPVVAIALILVVAVLAVVSFQSWYNDFQSGVFTDVEDKSSSGVPIEINNLIGDTLYVKSTSNDNISISSIKVGDILCNFTETNLTKGMNEIILEDCLNNSGIKEDVVLVTENNIDSKTFYLGGEETIIPSSSQADLTISFSSDATGQVGFHDLINLSWTVEGADECWGSGNWSGNKDNTSGYEIIQVNQTSLSFTLTCNDSNGTEDFVTIPLTIKSYSVPTSGLLVHYTFDNIIGNKVTDLQDNYNGTMYADVVQAPGLFNQGVEFDGYEDRIVISSNGVISTDGTFSVWAKSDRTTQNEIYSQYTNSDPQRTVYKLDHVGNYTLYQWDQTLTIIASNNISHNQNDYNHLVFVKNGTEVKEYINGDLNLHRSGYVNFDDTTTYLGYKSHIENFDFDGIMDQMRIYDRPLTKDEVIGLYLEKNQIGNQPDVNISANVTSADYGSTIELTWNSVNADNCVAQGNGWSGSLSTSGTQIETITGNPYENFTIVCSNALGQSDSDSVIVDLNCANITNGLAALYHFEGNYLDSSGNDNHGTNYGSVFNSSIIGQGVYFDGVNDYVRVSDDSTLDINDKLTILAWFHPLSGSSASLVRKGPGANGYYYLYSNGGFVRMVINDVGWNGAGFVSGGFYNEWGFVSGVYDRINRKAYFNASLVESVPYTSAISTNGYPLTIAQRGDNNEWVKGYVDEIAIYNRNLSQSELQQIYNANNQGNPICNP
jgi:hypothetical protein